MVRRCVRLTEDFGLQRGLPAEGGQGPHVGGGIKHGDERNENPTPSRTGIAVHGARLFCRRSAKSSGKRPSDFMLLPRLLAVHNVW